MGSSLALTDSITKSIDNGDHPTTKNEVGHISNLDDIKEIDEEVQYQIAQAQSKLSATSKASWKLCKDTPSAAIDLIFIY